MNIIFRGCKMPTTNEGYPIHERTLYIYELASPNDAKICEAKFQIPVREKSFFAQLYSRGNYLYLNVPGSADSLASDLLKCIKDY